MFKKYLALFCILGVMFTAVGCGQNADNNDENAIVDESQDSTDEDSLYEKPEVETYDLKPGEEAEGNSFNFILAGAEQYDKIKGKNYTDKPADGNVYLILYLAINNKTQNPVYIPADGITAEVDGKQVEKTYLVNDPDDMSTIFQTIEPGGDICGYLVWEVPEDWKKFTFTYTGLEEAGQDIITTTITPDMLTEPEDVKFEK